MMYPSPSSSDANDLEFSDIESMSLRSHISHDSGKDTKENPRYRKEDDFKPIPEPVGFIPNILDRGGWLLGE